MDGLALLQEARTAGLTVATEGGRLTIRGPRRAEAIARRLLDHKAHVLEALARATAQAKAVRPERPLNPDDLADAIAVLVVRLRGRGVLIEQVVLTVTADRTEP